MTTLRVAFWNRQRIAKASAQIAFLETVPWDVLLLAEVTRPAFRIFTSAFAGDSAYAVKICGGVPDRRYPHGCAAVVRNGWRISDAANLPPAADGQPGVRSERGLVVQLEGHGTSVTAATWHVVHAAGRTQPERLANRRAKQRAYQHLAAWIGQQTGPLVVGMDANTWIDWFDPADAEAPGDDWWTDERRFHGPDPSHKLNDTLRVVHSRQDGPHLLPLAVTHVIPSRPLRMDRIYTSPDIAIVDAGVSYKEGLDPRMALPRQHLSPRSDHALIWATLEPPVQRSVGEAAA